MRSITRLKRIMLIANGQRPTPKISPICVLVKLNCKAQVSMTWCERTEQKAVAIIAAQHAQNIHFCDAVVSPPESAYIDAAGTLRKIGHGGLLAKDKKQLRIDFDELSIMLAGRGNLESTQPNWRGFRKIPENSTS